MRKTKSKSIKKILKFKKEHKWWFVASVSLISILLFLLILNIGLNIRFLVNDELQINLQPLQFVSETNEDNYELDFNMNINTFKLCKTTCSMHIVDAYTGEISNINNLTSLFNKKFATTVFLSKTTPKFGEQIYYFEITCKNNKGFFCKTDEEKEYRSSLININYIYDNQTNSRKHKSKEILDFKQKEIIDALIFEEKYNYLIKNINKTIQTDYSKINGTSQNLNLWEEEYNNYLKQDFNLVLENLDKLDVKNTSLKFNSLKSEVEKYNQNILLLNILFSEKYNEILNFYKFTNNTNYLELQKKYFLIDQKDSFEEIISLNNLDKIYLDIQLLISNYTDEKIKEDFKMFEELNKSKKLISKNQNIVFEKELCSLAHQIKDIIYLHNQNLLSNSNYSSEINFIKNNIYSISENSTHLIGNSGSTIKYITLKEYLNYVQFPQINLNYCNISKHIEINNYVEINLSTPEFTKDLITISEPYKYSCVYNNCSILKETQTPILFIHGHSFNKEDPPESSISTFYNIRKKLSDDKLVINGGDIDYLTLGSGLWYKGKFPLAVSGTYFYVPYKDIDIFATSIKKEEGIEVYSIRLKELIDTTLSQTNSNKVILVAHSMGGLVARNYINIFGENKVEKLILISTPNKGISGRTETICSYFGEKKACEDMSENSIFMKRLENQKIQIPVHNIVAQGCSNGGDGVVTKESATLNWAENHYINGTCDDFLQSSLHTGVLEYDELYDLLKDLLN